MIHLFNIRRTHHAIIVRIGERDAGVAEVVAEDVFVQHCSIRLSRHRPLSMRDALQHRAFVFHAVDVVRRDLRAVVVRDFLQFSPARVIDKLQAPATRKSNGLRQIQVIVRYQGDAFVVVPRQIAVVVVLIRRG
jgi:hypothetical protein